MKKIMWSISWISLVGTAIVLQFMPERVPMHSDLSGNIDRWGSKNENLIFPLIILCMSLHWTLFIRYYDKKALKTTDEKERAEARSNAKVLSIVGLRITWSMYNDHTWRKSNRFGAFSFIIAGVLTIITALLMKSAGGATMAMLGYLILATIATLVYAYRVYIQEKNSERNNS